MWGITRVLATVSALTGTFLATAAMASASVTMGSTTPAPTLSCGNGTFTQIQTQSPETYAVPSAGVITFWSFNAGSPVPTGGMRLKTFRSTGSSNYEVTGASALEQPLASTMNTFPTRISVRIGDLIGRSWTSSTTYPCGLSATGYNVAAASGDAPVGPSSAYTPSTNIRLDLSAVLEPDADADGYGDETQDSCPTDATTQGVCPDRTPPETQITKAPKSKSKVKRAEFMFESSEAGSTFECSFDGKGFKDCVSPRIETVGKGKHSFLVRAADAAGNVDASPASARWTVVKKKHKHHNQ